MARSPPEGDQGEDPPPPSKFWMCGGKTRIHAEIANYLSEQNGKSYDPAARSFGNIMISLRGAAGMMENVGSTADKKLRLTDTCFLKSRPSN